MVVKTAVSTNYVVLFCRTKSKQLNIYLSTGCLISVFRERNLKNYIRYFSFKVYWFLNNGISSVLHILPMVFKFL